MYGCDGACKNFFNGSYACECDEKHVLAENGKTCEGQLPLIKIQAAVAVGYVNFKHFKMAQ